MTGSMNEGRRTDPTGDEAEIERIKSVYADYAQDESVLRRWREPYSNRLIIGERQAALEELLRRNGFLPLSGRRILDVGCADASQLARLREWGALSADLTGVDLLPDRVAAAQRAHPEFNITCCNAEKLPFDDESFDLVVCFVVLSSVLNDGVRRNIAAEIRRVLRSGGAVLWYDFRYRNPYNRNVRPVTGVELERLFPSYRKALKTVTVLPPLARRLGRLAATLYPLLRRLPLLRTHILGLLIKP